MELPSLPMLAARKRLHTMTGNPYDEALRDVFDAAGGSAKVWKAQNPMKAGDLLLTSVATAPRMYICIEIMKSDYDPKTSPRIDVDQHNWVNFDNGILVPAVDKALGWKVEAHATYRGGDARAILAAVNAEYLRNIPWFTPNRWRDVY
ncbi:hypothetical protein [Gordonia bronchialis]|uniref:hypothetical protein n=1 Tax=Gordonia bronchialis TaxID=2054 RepID=UPI00226D9245|nr:hypothetical protein [Gordonia bronchialis]